MTKARIYSGPFLVPQPRQVTALLVAQGHYWQKVSRPGIQAVMPSRAPSRPPAANPSASTTASTAPALVPAMPSKCKASSSSRRSRMPPGERAVTAATLQRQVHNFGHLGGLCPFAVGNDRVGGFHSSRWIERTEGHGATLCPGHGQRFDLGQRRAAGRAIRGTSLCSIRRSSLARLMAEEDDRCVAGPADRARPAHHIVHAEIGDINQHQAGENFAGVPPHASSISGINTNRAGQAHAVLSSAVDGLP
jgi:hypothetical protein